MTTHTVVLTEQAARELETAADWWSVHRSSRQAGRWYSGFSDLITSLSHSPDRFSLAHEDPEFPYELRELHYGLGGRPTHRAIFTIMGDVVVVLTIRHAVVLLVMPFCSSPNELPFGSLSYCPRS